MILRYWLFLMFSVCVTTTTVLAGDHIWSQRFGDVDQDVGLSVAVDGNDNVLVTGFFNGAVDFGGGVCKVSCVRMRKRGTSLGCCPRSPLKEGTLWDRNH